MSLSLVQFWSKLPSSGDALVRAPGGTCDHSACFLPGIFHNGTRPMLAVVGGEDNRGKALSDCWLLNIKLGVWKQVGAFFCSNSLHTHSQCTTGLVLSQKNSILHGK